MKYNPTTHHGVLNGATMHELVDVKVDISFDDEVTVNVPVIAEYYTHFDANILSVHLSGVYAPSSLFPSGLIISDTPLPAIHLSDKQRKSAQEDVEAGVLLQSSLLAGDRHPDHPKEPSEARQAYMAHVQDEKIKELKERDAS